MAVKSTSSTKSEKAAVLIVQCQHIRAESLFNIMHLLGIPAQIKKLASDLEVYDLLQKGLPITVLRSLLKKTGFSPKELSIALAITERTLKRLGAETNRNRRLSALQSVAVWQVATVFMRAQAVMGSPENAKVWLCSEARALRYRKPIELLALSPGVEFVSNVLLQLNYGVYL